MRAGCRYGGERHRRPGRVREERGLTLIEFTMAAAVAGVMFLVLYSILNTALDVYQVGQLRSAAVQSGRVALNRVVTDLRSARDIYFADDDRILIMRPIETSETAVVGDVDGYQEDLIGYFYSAGDFRLDRWLGTLGTDTFMDEVDGFTLRYRDALYNVLSTPVSEVQRIRYIEVELRLQEEDYQIALRNLIVLDNPVIVP